MGVEVDRHWVEARRRRGEESARVLAQTIGQAHDWSSSSENVLLAAAHLDPRPTDREELEALVDGYADAVEQLDAVGDVKLLKALSTYGRGWEVVIDAAVPVGRPASFHLTEDRRVELSRSGRFIQDLHPGAADSYHFGLRPADPAVEVRVRPEVALLGHRTGPDVELTRRTGAAVEFEDLQVDDESVALYESRDEVTDAVRLSVGLRPALHVRRASTAIEVLAWAAAASALVLRVSEAALGLILVPTTFAVSLLIVRERTPSSAYLLRWRRRRALVAFFVLWAAVAVRVASESPVHDLIRQTS